MASLIHLKTTEMRNKEREYIMGSKIDLWHSEFMRDVVHHHVKYAYKIVEPVMHESYR